MREISVGGQAVIEGVMMRSGDRVATAVRLENGKVEVRKQKYVSLITRYSWLNVPVIRGFVVLIEMIVLGMNLLMWSANKQMGEDEKLSVKELGLSVALSLVATIVLFIVAPFYISQLFVAEYGLLFNIIDGVWRVVIFVLYLVVIGFLSDIKRLFQYHGAEHKTVHCYEHKLRLTPRNAQQFPLAHPRCGTALILFVLLLSILVFSLIKSPVWWANLLARIVLIPVITGVAYEVIKFSARHQENFFVKLIIAPGLWMQSLTTREPSLDQLAVAIAALKGTVK